jgi:hypothetical protein
MGRRMGFLYWTKVQYPDRFESCYCRFNLTHGNAQDGEAFSLPARRLVLEASPINQAGA